MPSEPRCVLESSDSRYPAMLLDLPGEPPRLFVRGDPDLLSESGLAVVGSRRATPYGLAVAELAAKIAVESGIAVVSGGAVGCDQAAGRCAVQRGGRNVIVLGCGADVVYPKSSASLINRTIEGGGAVISLEPWGTPPRRYAFPKRNRIIAALSRATLVCEAGMPSGTFSTAETASDLGREVLAVPGSIFAPEYRGTNYLITVGATCIVDEESLEVAISRLYGTMRYCHDAPATIVVENGASREMLRSLVAQPMRIDELASRLGESEHAVMMRLSELSAAGLVEWLYDGRFAASKSMLHGLTSFGNKRP